MVWKPIQSPISFIVRGRITTAMYDSAQKTSNFRLFFSCKKKHKSRMLCFFLKLFVTYVSIFTTEFVSKFFNKPSRNSTFCYLELILPALRSCVLSPVHIGLTSAKPVSCYAFAVVWLLPSLSTGCLCGGIAFSTKYSSLNFFLTFNVIIFKRSFFS